MSENVPRDKKTAALVKRLQLQNIRMATALREVMHGLQNLDVDGWSEIDHLMIVCRKALPPPAKR
jgi:hypothetical protein